MKHPRPLAAGTVLVALLSSCSPGDEPAALPDAAIHPGLHAVLPSTAVAGKPVRLRVSPLDDLGTPDGEWRGQLAVEGSGFRTSGAFRPTGQGALEIVDLVFAAPGIHRVTVRDSDGRTTTAGPVLVIASEEELRPRAGDAALHLLWGDCHGHSTIGDGNHPAENYFFYAREIAHLDYTCLSEHDYQQFIDAGYDTDEGSWSEVGDLARVWRRPGFAVLLGWEWSSRVHGHRVVLFPDDVSRYVSYRRVSSPSELAEALRGTGAFSIVAHPTGSRLTPAAQWSTIVPGFDRAIEIYSGHGSMDGDPSFRPTSGPKQDAVAIRAIERGLRLAFVAFSDTHLTTPGNPSPPAIRDAPYPGGLTAVWARSASEADVFAALRDGHCYATSGERFLVELTVGDRIPGETLEIAAGGRVRVAARVAAPGALAWVEIVTGLDVEKRIDARGRGEIEIRESVGPLTGETAVWLRGESRSRERFWTTPVWVSVP